MTFEVLYLPNTSYPLVFVLPLSAITSVLTTPSPSLQPHGHPPGYHLIPVSGLSHSCFLCARVFLCSQGNPRLLPGLRGNLLPCHPCIQPREGHHLDLWSDLPPRFHRSSSLCFQLLAHLFFEVFSSELPKLSSLRASLGSGEAEDPYYFMTQNPQ